MLFYNKVEVIVEPSLCITVSPVWEELDRVREKTADFLSAHGLAGDVVDALVMVASELGENAVKYGKTGDAAHLTLELAVRSSGITVEVKNEMESGHDEHLRRLDTMIQWIRGYQDPFEAYLTRMEEVSEQALTSTESGLGLVRVAYEGKSVLDFYVDEHDVLAVSAEYLL